MPSKRDLYVPRSPHAEARSRQRGIYPFDCALRAVLEFGACFHAGGGRLVYYLSRRAVETARRLHFVRVERFRNLAIVVAPGGDVVTAYRASVPRKSWRRAR